MLTEEEVPYRRLWLSVILRTVEDARGQDLMCEGGVEGPLLRREAAAWLRNPDPLVLEWAGVTEEQWRRKYGM
jgi:hypothetical protein